MGCNYSFIPELQAESNPLQWRHNGRDNVSNHQPHDCLLNRLFKRRSKKTWKLRVTGLCAGNSPGTGEFPAQMASYAENVSIWWRHHAIGESWYWLVITFRINPWVQVITFHIKPGVWFKGLIMCPRDRPARRDNTLGSWCQQHTPIHD